MRYTALWTSTLSVLIAGNALAQDIGDRVENRADRRGDRIEQRLDQRGDRIDDRLDARSDRRLDRRGRQADRRHRHDRPRPERDDPSS